MKALVLKQYMEFDYTDVPEPSVGPNDVLIRVMACGICGSDVHGMDGSSGRRIPPIIMGHEASGVIEQIGKNVEGWQPGDRVTFDFNHLLWDMRLLPQRINQPLRSPAGIGSVLQ